MEAPSTYVALCLSVCTDEVSFQADQNLLAYGGEAPPAEKKATNLQLQRVVGVAAEVAGVAQRPGDLLEPDPA